MADLQLRVTRPVRGVLCAINGSGVLWRRKIRALPERRMLVPLADLAPDGSAGTIQFEIREETP